MAATKAKSFTENPDFRVPVAGLLAWLVPGLGHIFIGERVRGIILMAAITLTFWGGVAIGGVKYTVDPVNRRLWFVGQVCAGSHALAAVAWSRVLPVPNHPLAVDPLRNYGRTEEIAVVYTAIAGMLNVLIILDVLIRAERKAAPEPTVPPGRKRIP